MKKLFLALSCLPALLLAPHGFAAANSQNFLHGAYAQIEAGESFSNTENFHPQGDRDGWTTLTNNLSDPIGNSFLYGIGAGYRFNSLIRTDITYSQRDNFEHDKTAYFNTDAVRQTFDIKNKTLMANAYFNFNGLKNSTSWKLDPFVGFGLGYAWNEVENYKEQGPTALTFNYRKKKHNNFAWQLSLGITAHISKHLDADLGYRYLNIGKITTGKLNCTCSAIYDPLAAKDSDMQEIYLNVRYLI